MKSAAKSSLTALLILHGQTKVALVCMLATGAALAPAQVNPSFLNWTAEVSPTLVGPQVLPLNLRNLSNKQYLVQGSSGRQPNVQLSFNNIKTVKFVRQEFGSTELIRDKVTIGDLMALQVGTEFLFVERTGDRISLKTGKDPKFEWYAIGVGNVGADVGPTMSVGLLNARARDFLVFREGQGVSYIPLGWDKSNKSAAYMRGRVFVMNLRKKGFASMADLLKRVMGW